MNILKLKLASLLAALGLGVSVFFGLTPTPVEPTVGAQVYLPYQGGTGTGTAPDTGGKLLISTSSNVYTPAYLTAGSNITIASSSGGITISATGGGGSSTFTGLDFGVIGGSQVKITSQSFDAGMFDLSNTASEGFVRLDWTNGPASRSTTNTWTAVNSFSAGASVSSRLELAGTASISGQLAINNGAGTFVASGVVARAIHAIGAGSTKGIELGNITTDRPAIAPGSAAYLGIISGSTGILFYNNGANTFNGMWNNAGNLRIGDATSATARLEVNNGSTAQSIFVAQDNGSAVFTITDGGQAQVSNGTNPNLLVSGAGAGGVGGQFGSLRLGSNAGSYTTLDNNYNTGVFSTTNSWSSGTFTWLLGATEKMRINSSGVGIGTSSVDSSFELAGLASISNRSGGTTVAARINGGSSTGSILRLTNEVAGTPAILDFLSTSTMMTLVANNSLRLEAGGSGGPAGYLDLNYGSGLSTWANYSARQKILLNYNAATTTTKNSSYVLTQAIGAGAVGYGNGIALQGNSATVAARDMVRFNGVWTDATDASRTAVIVFDTVTSAGALTEVMRVGNSGASVSTNFEAIGYASSSLRYGSGLSTCTGSNVLQWSAGVFSCAAASGGGSAFNGIGFGTIGATDVNVASIQFDAGMFNLSNTASLGFVRLDWVNGPASRSTANTWADTQTFSSGAVGSFYTDATLGDNGLISGGADVLRFRNAGASAFSITGGSTFIGGTGATTGWASIVNSAGSASTPTYSFVSDENTGMYRRGTDVLGFAAGGTAIASVSGGGFEISGYASASRVFTGKSPSFSAPGYSFSGDPTTGLMQGSTSGFMNLVISGASVMAFNSGAATTPAGYDIQTTTARSWFLEGNAGSAAVPTYTFVGDQNTGMFTPSADVLNFGTGGVRIASGSSSGWELSGTASISNVPAISGTSTAVCIEAGGLIEQNTGSPTCTVSSLKYKENVRDLDLGLSDLLKLRAVSFTAKGNGKESIGFIAEEVLKIDERLVFFEADGKDPRGVNYEMFAPWVTRAIQEQQEQIDALSGDRPVGATGQSIAEQIDSLSVWQLMKLIVIKVFNLN